LSHVPLDYNDRAVFITYNASATWGHHIEDLQQIWVTQIREND